MTTHAYINVIIPFESRHSGDVDKVLTGLVEPNSGNRPRRDIERALNEIGIVHFMSITVVDAKCPAERDDPTPPRGKSHLIIEMSVDGGTALALTMLAARLRQELTRILDAAGVERDDDKLGAYMLRHNRVIGDSWRADALGQVFTGSPGQTARRVRDEETLAARIGALIDPWRHEPLWRDSSPRQRLDRVRDRLWQDGDTKWALVPEAAPCLGPKLNDKIGFSNPQAWKAGLTIANKLLWPVCLLFWLVVVVVFLSTWHAHGSIIAMLWTAYVSIGFIAVLGASGIAAYLWLRHLEKRDLVDDRTPPEQQVEELMKVENFCAQNHLASVSRLKPGWFRKLTLRLAFIVVGTGRFVGKPGFLGKNGVIHFARWMLLPGTEQMLFWSNYDGTWEAYVGDFIADAPTGVTAIWSNCVGFPRTERLSSGGANDRDRLVRWARRQQQPTRFWYSAYRELTAERIRTNAAIRQGVASAQSDADAEDWLNLFGSVPRPPEILRTTEIPTLVFGGMSTLRFSACHVIEFRGGVRKCKEWLALAASDAAYGEMLPGQRSAIVVALSATGLRKLDVPGDALATFPVPFQQGMWPVWRARALGDVDDNAPRNWKWGRGPDQPVDALLLVYGLTQNDLDQAEAKLLNTAKEFGHELVHSLLLATLPEKPLTKPGAALAPTPMPKEPFGFADGVSQPVIRGTVRSMTDEDPNHLIAPGEIVLGYPDNLCKIPPSPSICARHDPHRFLPDAGPDPFRNRPEFSSYEGNGERDLGANGTFLVVRQLGQDVAGFNEWLGAAAKNAQPADKDIIVAADSAAGGVTILGGEPPQADSARTAASHAYSTHSSGPDAAAAVEPATVKGPAEQVVLSPVDQDKAAEQIKHAIAARLIGRWKDGTSLVRNPQTPGTAQDPTAVPDNGFLFGREDPRGLSCPFGAHIRRANPRDQRFPASVEEIAATNRHRILRVGRAYGNIGTNDPGQGLLFMCLNADIDRQFEFIQKTWLLNPNVHGLENEIDPMMGRGSRKLTLQTATGPALLKGLGDFVRVIGGAYLFLPGRAALRYLARA